MSGRPRGPIVAALPLAERVWGEVNVTEAGCWEWPHRVNRDGYAVIKVDGRSVRVHRVAYELASGRVLVPGEVVRHHCDNPPCVNPEHLEVGTQADNVADMMRRGRLNVTPPISAGYHGEEHPGHVLTTAQVVEIRAAEGTMAEIGARFGVSGSLVCQIRLRKAWKHVA